jgi:hypothetical protein
MDLVDDLKAFERKKICEKVRAYYKTDGRQDQSVAGLLAAYQEQR